ncbi:hypothetical protein WG66_008662 [Moniliophthora roreri]|nr:hypothetical protein WG66_008662 [Moniliophthora roreri]
MFFVPRLDIQSPLTKVKSCGLNARSTFGKAIKNFRRAISTGGFGLHDGGANGPDSLFSQGAIQASSASNMLAIVNAGSNTLTLLSINPRTYQGSNALERQLAVGAVSPFRSLSIARELL